MFIAAVFTIVKTWKESMSSADKWIKKTWCIYIYNEILLSHKNNEILPFAATWMNIEGIILREISQRTKSIV